MGKRKRFDIDKNADGWLLIDNTNGKCLEFRTKKEATNYKSFCLLYVNKWGDIDFYHAPLRINEPLEHD